MLKRIAATLKWKWGKSIFINKTHKGMPNYEYIFTSFSSEKILGRHIITTLLNMNIVKHELESMDTNISKVWRIINLFLLQIKETWDFNKPLTQLAHRLLILVLFESRFFIVSFRLIMINWPKSSLSKKKRKVQHNSVIYTVIFLPNHQFCCQEEGTQWTGKERREGCSGQESTCALEFNDSAEYMYNSV